MSLRLTEEEYVTLQASARNARKTAQDAPGTTISPKRHKYRAQRVTIGGIAFASKWEGKTYTDFRWQFLAGLVTEPLLQVRFAIGVHYGRMRYYVADLVTVDLKTHRLLVVEAKGALTATYKQKKKVFEDLYGITICEIRRK